MESFLSSHLFLWCILPALIFCARIVDVSMGTVRLILISRGIRWLAPVIGFFEVILWLISMSQIMRNLTNPACYLAFGAGHAIGTYAGMFIEGKLAIGKAVIRIITNKDATGIIDGLREANCGVTSLDAQGATGPVKIIFSIIPRREQERILGIIKSFDPFAFYTIGDVKFANEGVFPPRDPKLHALSRFLHLGK